MSLDLKITDLATPAVIQLMRQFEGRRVHAVIGEAISLRIQEHLQMKDAQPNKRGWPKTHFYARARSRTTWAADDRQATVTIAMQGFRQRYQGGRIQPVNKRALTIPQIPEAYGKAAGEFGSSLRFDPVFGAGRLIGVLRGRPGTPFAGKVVYNLVTSVLQKADPSVLPTGQQMWAAAEAALTRLFNRAVTQPAASGAGRGLLGRTMDALRGIVSKVGRFFS